MSPDDFLTSPVRRFLRLGGLAGRVGASVVGERILDIGRSESAQRVARGESLLKQATRIVETLGEMKGAAMKVGQMLSLQEGLLPPEVAAILRSLQKEAPSVPFEVMRYEVEGGLGVKAEEVFATLDPEPMAAASIGQVHRATLHDGRRVAVKIQYPLIDQIVEADLGNLQIILGRIFALFSGADFEPIWLEVRDRLLEEIDYVHEAETLGLFAERYAEIPEVVIPRVIKEASAKNVLTMELVEGLSPDEACSSRYSQELKDRWGRVLFEFTMRGLFEHRLLHADPNLANFAFREDGSLVVYDFGCVKRIPKDFAVDYARLFVAGASGRRDDIPRILLDLGVHREDGSPLPQEIVDDYVKVIAPILREDPPYTFDEDQELYNKLFDLGMQNLSEARDVRFPQDLIFVDRCLGGHFGNLRRLRATGPWRRLVLDYCAARLANDES